MFKQNRKLFRLFAWYCIFLILLTLYSFTQTDLNLTISRIGFIRDFQQFFQNIGYYHRFISLILFTFFISGLFVFYAIILRIANRSSLTKNQAVIFIAAVAIITLFSYPAFSYDFFNYMFTAKTVLVYHKNPYEVLPIQFASIDPWLSFMRWTHLPSAYTPFWIIVSLVPFIFGFGKLILVLYNFKLMFVFLYLISVMMVYKITNIYEPESAVRKMLAFALHPLVIIEALVSPHNDMLMVAFALFSYFLYLKRNYVRSIFYLSLSVASKLMTAFLFPAYLVKWNRKAIFWMMAIAVIAGFIRKEFLPWYFLWIIPFTVFNMDNKSAFLIVNIFSAGLLFSYAPYIYFGEYSGIMKLYRNYIYILTVLFSAGAALVVNRYKIVRFIRKTGKIPV